MRHAPPSRWIFFACLLSFVVAAAAAAPTTQRRWTVRDGIERSVFLRPGNQYLKSAQVQFSPDGKHFIAATMRGDVQSGKRIATIWLFDADQVAAYLRDPDAKAFSGAKRLLETGSASSVDPITGWVWSGDSQNVLYLAADDDGAYRLYRKDIGGGEPVALSRADQDVSRFDERGGNVVYLAHPPIRADMLHQAAGSSLPDIVDGTGQNLVQLMFPHWMASQLGLNTDELWRVRNGQPIPVLAADRHTPIRLKNSKLALSPDGSRLLVTTYVYRIPKSWERYKPRMPFPGLQMVADTPATVGDTGSYRARQYALVNLETGAMSLLADSPTDLLMLYQDAVTAAWSPDGSRVAVPGAYPPLATAAGSDAIYPCTFAVVVVATKAFSCLDPTKRVDLSKRAYSPRKQVVSLAWNDAGRELVARFSVPRTQDQTQATVYAQDGHGAWTERAGHAANRAFAVSIQQALDEPPVLMASAGDGKAKPLLDPNPQLKDIARGTVELYHWKDPAGNTWNGALVKPPDFKPGHRYPLVIQTHGLAYNKFFVEGPSATSYAARALAARDMLVLQVDEIRRYMGTPEESETGAAGYRAAVGQLAKDGLIDPRKVGIIAWSHFGPYVYQGMIDQPGLYKAATFAEADASSYTEYLGMIDYMGRERETAFRAQMGGAQPFGKGLAEWIKRSPAFHLDRICTPVLMFANDPVALMDTWYDYAPLRAQGKPVDLVYIRNGDHDLIKPRQRMAEQGRNVDWYDYWLNGRKDPDPAKAKRYKLWDAMKASMPVCAKDLPVCGKP